MATVKVKFRKSSVAGKPGSIYYQLCHENTCKLITTKMHIPSRAWNALDEQIITQGEHRLKMYQLKIQSDMRLLRRIIREMDERRKGYTLEDIVEAFRANSSQVTVLEYMQRQIERLQKRKHYGTAKNYQYALNSFSAFLGHEDLSFGLMNEGLILQYNDWLECRNVLKNSISFYMRIWRAVYNRAAREGIVEQSLPFQNVYTGIDRTRKRAVDEEIILKLLELDLTLHPSLALSRDLFVFSYCARGMAFVDMAFLKKRNIENNRICYHRRKTDQLMMVRLEPCMIHILRKYEDKTRDSQYVFPILTAEDDEKAFVQYHTALGYHNRKLKKLAQMTGLPIALSSYTSRHTWATTARRHNVPLSIISAGMGHSSERTTEIYLASLENSVIDEANSGLLTDINRCISF